MVALKVENCVELKLEYVNAIYSTFYVHLFQIEKMVSIVEQ